MIEPLLPLGERGPIPDLRRLVNGVMWRFRTGSPWRDMPQQYESWFTVYGRFHLWAGAEVFQALMEAVIAEAAARGQAELGLVSVDSTSARAHHHAAGMMLDLGPGTSEPAAVGDGTAAVTDRREALRGIALAMYRLAFAHPHVVPLVATRPLTVPMARRPLPVLRCHERLLAILQASGLTDAAALKLYRAFVSWVLGYIVVELREVVDDPDEPDPAFRLGLHRLPARDFPRLRALGPALAVRGGEEQLGVDLDALLDRLTSDS